jgi:hypothetical protein
MQPLQIKRANIFIINQIPNGRKSQNGNSMVEYAIGIGCVVAVCMLVLGGLGGAAEDVVLTVLQNINAPNDQTVDPTTNAQFGIFSGGVTNPSNPPWRPQ